MLTDELFPAELQLRVDRIEMEENAVNISVTSTNERSVCPHCQTISSYPLSRELMHTEKHVRYLPGFSSCFSSFFVLSSS